MAITEYTHQEKGQIFEQFKLLPENQRLAFLRDVTNNPEISANQNLIAAGMQGLINQHVAAQCAHPFAALLAGHNDVLASFASMQGIEHRRGAAPEGNRVTKVAALDHDDGMGGRFA